ATAVPRLERRERGVAERGLGLARGARALLRWGGAAVVGGERRGDARLVGLVLVAVAVPEGAAEVAARGRLVGREPGHGLVERHGEVGEPDELEEPCDALRGRAAAAVRGHRRREVVECGPRDAGVELADEARHEGQARLLHHEPERVETLRRLDAAVDGGELALPGP